MDKNVALIVSTIKETADRSINMKDDPSFSEIELARSEGIYYGLMVAINIISDLDVDGVLI